MVRRSPMRPVEQTTTSPRRDARAASPTCSAVRVRVREALGPGAHVRAAGVEHDGVARRRRATACRDHTTGAATTRLRGEDARRPRGRAVVDDEGDVAACRTT